MNPLKAFLIGICVALGAAAGWLAVKHYRAPTPQALPSAPQDGNLPAVAREISYWLSPPPMGGVPFEIRVWGRSPMAFIEDSQACADLVEALEREVSEWREESATSAINRAATGQLVDLPPNLAVILKAAFALNTLSGGAFNPALGPLIELWREAARRGKEPVEEELASLRDVCTMASFQLEDDGAKCRKLKDGARLGLGAIAKGHIVDKVVEMLELRGIPAGIITAGGDRRIFGTGVSRKVGIRHPEKRGELYGYFHLQNGAVCTSGNYERPYVIGEKIYGHIFDPRTFAPTGGPLSATVIAKDAITADGLATTLFVLGKDEGMALLEKLPGVDAMFLYREGDKIRQYRTKGFPEILELNDLPAKAEE
jgi:thiamine biosynthesis lipoprotein